jgi:hypothetical protein
MQDISSTDTTSMFFCLTKVLLLVVGSSDDSGADVLPLPVSNLLVS